MTTAAAIDLVILRKSCFKTRKSSKTSALLNIYDITLELELISQLPLVRSLCLNKSCILRGYTWEKTCWRVSQFYDFSEQILIFTRHFLWRKFISIYQIFIIIGKRKIRLAIDNCKDNRKGKKLYASQMQRVVHLASYFLQFEFLIAICLSHLRNRKHVPCFYRVLV